MFDEKLLYENLGLISQENFHVHFMLEIVIFTDVQITIDAVPASS